MLSLKRIGELADNRQTYLRGVSAYNAGKIEEISRRPQRYYREFIEAVVRENATLTHAVEVGLDDTDSVIYKSCDCSTFCRTGGVCKHMVAVLTHKYYADMLGGIPEQSTDLPTQNDTAVSEMLANYIQRRLPSESRRHIRLEPILHVAPHRLSLTFVLRDGRTFPLRDLKAFCQAVINAETAEYGNQLRFSHKRSQFHKDSLPVLDFLLRHISQQQAFLQENGTASPSRPSRELPLSAEAAKEFFRLFSGHSTESNYQTRMGSCEYLDGNPLLSLKCARSEKGYSFTLESDVCFCTDTLLYLPDGGRLYRCTDDYTVALSPFWKALEQGHGILTINETDMPIFCAAVLPDLRRHTLLVGEIPNAEDYPLPTPSITLFLDCDSLNTVFAHPELDYNGVKVNPYTEASKAIVRNPLIEQELFALLNAYFPAYDPQNDRLVLQGDDDMLFLLLSEGIERLRSVADIMISDAFRHISPQRLPTVNVGVQFDGERLLQLDWHADGLSDEDIHNILQRYRLKKKYYRLTDGRFLLLQDENWLAFSRLSAGLALNEKEVLRGQVQLPAYRALYLERFADSEPNLLFSRSATFKRLVDGFETAFAFESPVPASLSSVLRDYQVTGFRWLKALEQLGCGGIMADEMGLGKTIETIALFADAKARTSAPSLVVCPTSLVLNWESEIRRFAPGISVLPIIGSAEQRANLITQIPKYDVIITSYDILKRDIALYTPYVFHYHIIDEAQYIKNPRTQAARAVRAIRSKQRFALTGTPIENRISELWSIFDFLMPGFLYSYTRYKTHFETPIMREDDETALEQLRRLVEPFVLRRLKKDVLHELPPKTEQTMLVSLDEQQKELYTANLAQARREAAVDGTSKMQILALLMRLRQICCSPALCYEDYRENSAKIDSCMECVRQGVEGGHKILIFSQFTSLLDLLEPCLRQESIGFYRLDGTTSKEQRQQLVQRFNNDSTPVFLLSLKAGGTGLNLSGADIVIHFDPWWNPAVQEQATDRAHRIGQIRTVQVIKLVAKDTIEERIMHLQQRKQDLSDSLIQTGEGLSSLSTEQLRALLEID